MLLFFPGPVPGMVRRSGSGKLEYRGKSGSMDLESKKAIVVSIAPVLREDEMGLLPGKTEKNKDFQTFLDTPSHFNY
jgi:hypothetical protein